MDLSKLPKLSETDKHTPMPPPQSRQEAEDRSRKLDYEPFTPASSAPAQVWLAIVLGVIFMMIGWNFARFCIAKVSGQTFHTNVTWTSGPKAGQEVEYFELSGYTAYTDTGIFLFGVASVLEGLLLALVRQNTARSRAMVMTALTIAFGATLFNLVVVALLFQANITPLMSLLIVAFGGYMAVYEWQLLKQMQHSIRA